MKRIFFAVLLAAVAALVAPLRAHASPYFRFYGWDYQSKTVSLDALQHPKFVFGALLDPVDLGASEAASLLPLITHSPKDGCLMPSIVCEDWSPFAIGGSMNAGKITFDVAPLFNVFPWMVSGLQKIAPAKYQGLFQSAPSAVTFSAGPVWQYRQADNKGYFKVFTGLALQF